MNDTEDLSKEFYSLRGSNVSEKRKHLNYYIKKIKANVKSEDDLNILTKSIIPRNELERSFKVEILLQLQRNEQILEVLRAVDPVLNAKICKNWQFLSDVFSKMNCHAFFNDITPYISNSCTMKIITRLSKVLTNEDLADEYFNVIREEYGIRVARRILPACSIDLVRSAIQIWKMFLTDKELLTFAKKDKDFLSFYFNILQTLIKKKCRFGMQFRKTIQYIGRTDAHLFWQLYDLHQFNNPTIDVKLGESVIDFLFAQDESKMLNADVCVYMFSPRRIYNVLSKRGKMDVLFASFCRGDEDEFYKIYLEKNGTDFYSIRKFLDRMPKLNYFQYLNGAFKIKFGKDLLDYPKYFKKHILKITPTPEREKMLDALVKENDDLVYLYDIKRSIPLLREKLDTNVENPDHHLKQLYRCCKRHQLDEDALLGVLKYITENYRHREHLIDEINMKMVQWPNAENFKPDIWNLIDEMLKIIEYSDEEFCSSAFTDYIHKRIINSVNNDIPLDKLFRALLTRRTGNFYNFGKSNGNIKKYYEEVCKLMVDMRKRADFLDEIKKLLSYIVQFNSTNRSNSITLSVYGHLFEVYAKRGLYCGNDVVIYGAQNNVHSSFHDLYWRRYRKLNDYRRIGSYLQRQPEIFLKNITLVNTVCVKFLKESAFENFTGAMRSELCNYCFDILTLKYEFNASNVAVALQLLHMVAEEEFIHVIKRIDLAKLHEIDDSKNVIKNVLSKCLMRSARVARFLPVAVKIHKNTQIKNYLSPIYSYLHKIPLDQTKGIIKLFSENSGFRFRRLSVTLADMFLTKSQLYDWIKEMNKKETDRSVKRHLCKKAFYLFIENQNVLNWSLLKDNIDLVGNDSRCVLELWSKLRLISPDYCERFATHSFNAVSKDGNVELYKKKLMTAIIPPVHGNFSFSFLKDLLEDISFYTTRTRNRNHFRSFCVAFNANYYMEFLFYTSGDTQDSLLEFMFEKVQVYVDENWSDFPDDEVVSNVHEFMISFCNYSFELRPIKGIVTRFYHKWKSLFPASYVQSKFLMLEFLHLYFECDCEVIGFSKKCNELLSNLVDCYGGSILGIYCRELKQFRDAAHIDRLDFLIGFTEGKSDAVTYSAAFCIIPYTYEPILTEKLTPSFRNCNEPVVNMYFSEYFAQHF